VAILVLACVGRRHLVARSLEPIVQSGVIADSELARLFFEHHGLPLSSFARKARAPASPIHRSNSNTASTTRGDSASPAMQSEVATSGSPSRRPLSPGAGRGDINCRTRCKTPRVPHPNGGALRVAYGEVVVDDAQAARRSAVLLPPLVVRVTYASYL